MLLRPFAIAAALCLSTASALADTPAAPMAPPPAPVVAPDGSAIPDPVPPDPERLAIAEKIIVIVLPPERTEAMTSRIMALITKPMLAQASTAFQSDAGLARIWDDYVADITRIARDTVHDMIPGLRVAYAQAYARYFSRDELAQILAFGQTPVGAKYLSRASDLLQDSSIQAVMMQSMTDTRTRIRPAIETFKTRLQAYLAAHPEVAKKIDR
jgi:hypothetical protein